ncbi:uncharacterized protein KY384_008122 [Bacidia gigantensis]|uniref:uncharacterized protein n=1 Tax=Bacidia gigantensis TaxID=2732470 RepID=UPI001D0429D5|nr:uncharacterized protein KY384_008122 [Bacidia gigantensis]KAG8526693.1 hypothetical protein KY384_008122 [Bacidia gigantensis]
MTSETFDQEESLKIALRNSESARETSEFAREGLQQEFNRLRQDFDEANQEIVRLNGELAQRVAREDVEKKTVKRKVDVLESHVSRLEKKRKPQTTNQNNGPQLMTPVGRSQQIGPSNLPTKSMSLGDESNAVIKKDASLQTSAEKIRSTSKANYNTTFFVDPNPKAVSDVSKPETAGESSPAKSSPASTQTRAPSSANHRKPRGPSGEQETGSQTASREQRGKRWCCHR